MKRVLELPAFRRLLVAAVLNELAFSIGSVALALLVYRRTGSAIGATAFFLCSQFGPALISPFLVARLDQESARRVLGWIYTLEALIFAVLAWLVGRFSVAPVLILALVDGVLATTGRVLGRSAWVPAAGEAGVMREANALLNTSLSICLMVGPALGGVIVALGGTRLALSVNVGLFVVVTITVATASGLPIASSDHVAAFRRLRTALSEARRQRLIRRLLGLEAAAIVFVTISIPVEVVFAQHTLHAGAGGYGLMLAAWGAGAIAGSGIYVRWRELTSRLMITLGTCLLGVGFLVMALAPSLAVAVIGAAVAGIGNGIQVVALRTALQEAIPDAWMALLLSLNESIILAAPGAGMILGGAITSIAGPRAAFAVGAGGSLAIGLVMWVGLTPARQVGNPPDSSQVEDETIPPPLTAAGRRP